MSQARTAQIVAGESYSVTFQLKDSDGDVIDLTNYSFETYTTFNNSTISGFGAVSEADDDITFELTDAESEALTAYGQYLTRITATTSDDADYAEEVMVIQLTVNDPNDFDKIPLSPINVVRMLGITESDLRGMAGGWDLLEQMIPVAMARTLAVVSDDVQYYTREYGWPKDLVSNTEYLCYLMMRVHLYDENTQDMRDMIESQLRTISQTAVDTTGDGDKDTGSSSVQFAFRGFQAAGVDLDRAKENNARYEE